MAEEKNIKAILADAIKKRDDLNTFIKVLQEMSGTESSTGDKADSIPKPPDQSATGEVTDPLTVVYPGMFFGRSQTQAAKLLLERVRRPLKTRSILDCFEKGGMKTGGKNPATNLWGVLNRSEVFVLVPKAGWGLSDWYDPSVIAKMKKDAGTEASEENEENSEEKKP